MYMGGQATCSSNNKLSKKNVMSFFTFVTTCSFAPYLSRQRHTGKVRIRYALQCLPLSCKCYKYMKTMILILYSSLMFQFAGWLKFCQKTPFISPPSLRRLTLKYNLDAHTK